MKKKLPKEPVFESHLNEDGKYEKVDVTKYSMRVLCSVPGCLQIRYVLPQDYRNVKYCKPHALEARRKYRSEYMKSKRRKKRQQKSDTNTE